MTGSVSITCIIQLPIRYQTSVGASPLQAGVRLLPFVLCGPLGVIITASISKKRRVPPLYSALAASILQMLGLIFISRGPADNPDWTPLYGLEVLTGLGMGMSIGIVTLLTPYVAENRDLGKHFIVNTSNTTTWLRIKISGCISSWDSIPLPRKRFCGLHHYCSWQWLGKRSTIQLVDFFAN